MSYLQNQLKSFNASVVESANRMPAQRRVVNNQPVSASSSQVPSSAPTPSSSTEIKKKRHDPDIVYSQPANTGTGKDIMTQVLFAIEHMKNKNIALKFSDIISYLSLQHRAHDQGYVQALRSILQMHEKVEFDPSGANGEGTFRFRPPHNIRKLGATPEISPNPDHCGGYECSRTQGGLAHRRRGDQSNGEGGQIACDSKQEG